MEDGITFVGLDVHKETIAVAVADGGSSAARSIGTIPNRPEAVLALVRRLGRARGLRACYEAGPCGYTLQRQLTRLGVDCVVVAPSLVPVRVGDRVKTDRRDAMKLAGLLRSGQLTPVWTPDEEHEALRDLVRAREVASQDLLRCRHRLSKLLLRLGVRPPAETKPWTAKHRVWLQGLRLPHASQQIVLGEYLLALDQQKERVSRLDAEIAQAVSTSAHAALIAALQAMRGVGPVTAATLVAELGDIRRFRTPRELMAYAGLVPSEHSSGGSQWRGRITRTGNAHVRRVMVEAAWHYRHTPSVFGALRSRQSGQPETVKAIAWKAQSRLHRRYRRMVGRGKLKQQVVVAIAREMLGFVWAIAQAAADPGPALLRAEQAA
ncbi:MAG: IS110 family transposase [Anaerolineae bacterium]